MNRKHLLAAALTVLTVLLTGCEQKTEEEVWVPGNPDAVSVDTEGHVTEYLTETLDQPYYSFQELHAMLLEEVSDYNAASGSEKIQVIDAKEEGKKVSLVLQYDSWKDVADFNQIRFYAGSMIGAQLEGYLFDGTYHPVKNGNLHSESVAGSSVLAHMDEMVVVTSLPMEIHVPGTVTFISSGMDLLGRQTAAERQQEAEQETEQEPAGESGAEDSGELRYVIYNDRE